MQQRRPRLGDIVDDYCPRERRITNHAVVAMIEDDVRQTRCTTCDAEHEYKQARVPVSRRRKGGEGALPDVPELPGSLVASTPPRSDAPADFDDEAPPAAHAAGEQEADEDVVHTDAEDLAPAPGLLDDDGPVHRRLIRATLPRPEGQVPERKAPDFTLRQPSNGRFEAPRNNNNNNGRRRGRPQQMRQGGQQPGPMRSGNAPQGSGRHGADTAAQGRHGNRTGNDAAGARGGRPPGGGGANRGPRQGGQGRKRGR